MEKPQRVVLICIVINSLFWGVMIASAGVALFPKLANVSAWFVCGKSEYVIDKTHYSYRPGQSGYYLTFYSSEERRPEDEIHPLLVTGASALIYFFFLLIITIGISPLYFRKFAGWVETVLRNNGRL